MAGQAKQVSELEGSSVLAPPTLHIPMLSRGHRNVELRCGQGRAWPSPPLPVLHRLARKASSPTETSLQEGR